MTRILLPEGWPRPRGYSNGVSATGRVISVAGQIGWTRAQQLVPGGLVPQTRQALENIVSVLRCDGAGPEHIVRLTWYVTDLDAYRAAGSALGEAYRAVMGAHYPAMSAVGVTGLVEPGALIEIEATAIVPEAR